MRRGDVERFLLDDHNLGKYFHDKYVVSHTSGSQGRPLLLMLSEGQHRAAVCAAGVARKSTAARRARRLAGQWFHPARLATVMLKPGFYPSSTAFEYMPEGVRPLMQVLRLSVGDEDLVDRLKEFRPTHLTGYASMLHDAGTSD